MAMWLCGYVAVRLCGYVAMWPLFFCNGILTTTEHTDSHPCTSPPLGGHGETWDTRVVGAKNVTREPKAFQNGTHLEQTLALMDRCFRCIEQNDVWVPW